MNDADDPHDSNGSDESAAKEALAQLGFTQYEVAVFVALQKLGTASASDIDRIAEVPRSQVYGAAEKLEDRGLVEVQQSNPIRFRAVGLEEARERLHNRFEKRRATAFEHLEAVQSAQREPLEQQEDVWTINGTESVTARSTRLVRDAQESIVYAGGPEAFDDGIVVALIEGGLGGVTVTVLSADDAVAETFEDVSAVSMISVPARLTLDNRRAGRMLVADDDTVLLSVRGDDGVAENPSETAIWSSRSGFAAVIVQLLDAWFAEHLERDGRNE